MSRKLNLGSGEFRKDGYINVDFGSVSDPDVVHDLNVFPYPFESNYFDFVEADHVIEHLDEPFAVMKEIHRITRNGGGVLIRTPHFSRGSNHPKHQRGFDVSFPFYFQPSFRGGYQGIEFELKKLRLRWLAQHYLKREIMGRFSLGIATAFGALVDCFANLSPIICSRLWCYLVGGFEEIEYNFIVKK